MRFIDLFAGLGGFHLALSQLGHRCVFASEIDLRLREIYEENFGLAPSGDIRTIPMSAIPRHDILCAGFPCQPFSKAGEQSGFGCPSWGDLFKHVVAILAHHKPEFVLLENVANLVKHASGRTWAEVTRLLESTGYGCDARVFSPHQFGVPQIRERVYIVARRGGLKGFVWPECKDQSELHVSRVLDKHPIDAKPLTEQVRKCLEMWQRFIRRFPKNRELPTFPIWAMEFGANYPYEDAAPASVRPFQLRRYCGAYGRPLAGKPDHDLRAGLPPYARGDEDRFPEWKIDFIRKNRLLYTENKKWIDAWRHELLQFPASLQKLEWNCKGGERDIWKYVIQLRASGVRVKSPTTAPSLIAMTVTQVPIIAWEERYMTPKECARLQSMDSLRMLPETSTAAYKALGNAVNVDVVRVIAASHVGESRRNDQKCRRKTGHKSTRRRARVQSRVAT